MTPQELSKLDYEGASQMILADTIDAKKYEKEIAALRSEAQDWKARAAEAQSKAVPELSQAALQRASQLESKALELSAELVAIRRDIEQLQEALPIIKAKQRRVDPDQLLAELSMIVGLDNLGEQQGSSRRGDSTTSNADKDSKTIKDQDELNNKGSTSSADTTNRASLEKPINPPDEQSPVDHALDEALAELKKKMGLL